MEQLPLPGIAPKKKSPLQELLEADDLFNDSLYSRIRASLQSTLGRPAALELSVLGQPTRQCHEIALPGLRIKPILFEVLDVKELPRGDAYSRTLDVTVRTWDVNKHNQPLLVHFLHTYDHNMPFPAAVHEALLTALKHELDECLRTETGEHIKDPHEWDPRSRRTRR